MEGKEIRKHRYEGSDIPNGFIFIWGVRFSLDNHFRMVSFKIIIQEGDVAYDAQAIGEDGEFIGITEMTVDVLLSGIGTGNCMGRHKGVSHFIRVIIGIALVLRFQLTDKGVEGFGIVFLNEKFNARGVKGKDLCQVAINLLADGFGIVDHFLEHEFNVPGKAKLKTCKQRSIGGFGKPAESPKFFTET